MNPLRGLKKIRARALQQLNLYEVIKKHRRCFIIVEMNRPPIKFIRVADT